MNTFNKFSTILIATFAIFFGCEDRTDLTAPAAPSTGTANFASFVTIGNSLTAGYQSGSLYQTAQEYSFGNMIAKQVKATYAQAMVADPGTGGRIEISSLEPFSTKINSLTGTPLNTTYAAPYNNLGVPGATLYDVLNATSSTTCYSNVFGGSPNPMFDLVLRGNGSQFAQAKAVNPTLLTLWIGNNDILGYATQGGTVPFTPLPNFNAMYAQLADSISSLSSTKVLVANVPNVLGIPYFTTVGGQLKMQGMTHVFITTSSGVAFASLDNNLLTLPASTELALGKGVSPATPLSNAVVLDSTEIANVVTIIPQYNATIQATATAKGWHLVNMDAFFSNVISLTLQGKKLEVDGLKFDAIYVSGGLFSLDGVHPTSQGYAIIANEFLKVINSKFGASIPMINVATIPGSLPFSKAINFGPLGLPIFEKGTFDHLLF